LAYNILYKKSVSKDLRKIDKRERAQIFKKLQEVLSKNPKRGKKLKGRFRELYSYRIGDYRVVYTFVPQGVLVLRVSHRKEIYRK